MTSFSRYLPFVAAMALVVVASNILVQFPVQGQIGGLSLADILTWGAFTYPFAFLVTDLANRRYGPAVARRMVFVGFMTAVVCSILVPPLLFRHGLIEFETAAGRLVRIAAASGAAFLTAQLLDVTVFNRLRRQSWWRAPIVRHAGRLGVRHDDLLHRRLFGGFRLRRARGRFRAGSRAADGRIPRRRHALDLLGARRSLGEADHRRLRADPLPADRRPLEPAGAGGLDHDSKMGSGLGEIMASQRP